MENTTKQGSGGETEAPQPDTWRPTTKVDGPQQAVLVYTSCSAATELEFYFPAAIWSNPHVRDFVRKFSQIPGGATIIKSTVGMWKGDTEDTHILRLLVRRGQLDRSGLRGFAQNRISELTAQLSVSAETRQEAVIFTDKEVMVSESTLNQPVTRPDSASRRPKPVTSKHIT